MLKKRRFWLGAIFSAAFLVLFFWKIDLSEAVAKVKEADYRLIPAAMACYFAAVYFRTLRWHFLLLPLKSVPVRRLYPIVVIGYMANNLLPVRLGEVVRSYFAGRKEGLPKAATLATILIERVFDGIFLLLLAVVVWPFLPVVDLLSGMASTVGVSQTVLVLLVSAPFVVVFVGFFTVALFPAFGRILILRALVIVPGRLREPLQALAFGFLDGLRVLRSPRRVLSTALLTAPVWMLEATMYYLMGLGFRLGVPYHAFLLTTSSSNLATSLPSSAGGVGLFEYATKLTLEAMAVSPEVAAAYAIVLHAVLLAPVTLLGMLFLWLGNMSLSEAAKQSTGTDGQDRVGPLVS